MPGIETSIGVDFLKEKDVTISLQIFRDIRVLIRNRINGNTVIPLKAPRIYEVQIMPLSMPGGRRRNIFAREVDGTRSNLG